MILVLLSAVYTFTWHGLWKEMMNCPFKKKHEKELSDMIYAFITRHRFLCVRCFHSRNSSAGYGNYDDDRGEELSQKSFYYHTRLINCSFGIMPKLIKTSIFPFPTLGSPRIVYVRVCDCVSTLIEAWSYVKLVMFRNFCFCGVYRSISCPFFSWVYRLQHHSFFTVFKMCTRMGGKSAAL